MLEGALVYKNVLVCKCVSDLVKFVIESAFINRLKKNGEKCAV